jgi:AhpD family alkylhydroperoxidase
MTHLVSYDEAPPRVRAVYDDILATRKTDYINNLWKALANDPGALDPVVRELIYIAVSVTNNCEYCIATHTASAYTKGMTAEMFAELMAIIGLANETNRLAIGYRVQVDERYT